MARRQRRGRSAHPSGASSPSVPSATQRLTASANRGGPRRLGVSGLVAVLALIGVAILVALWLYPKPKPLATTTPGAKPPGYGQPGTIPLAYVKSAACAECHPTQYRGWAGSHHDLAMQPATAETVRGDFNDIRVNHRGLTSRFFKREGKFFVNTEGPDGKSADFEIRYTFGVAPLQQYLVEFPGGRLQGLTIAWDTAKKRWFPLYPSERHAPDDPLHWTGRYQNWNAMCADCHSTDLQKNYDPATDTYKTADASCCSCLPSGSARARRRSAKLTPCRHGTTGRPRRRSSSLCRLPPMYTRVV